MRKGSRTAVKESLNKKENGQGKYFLLYQSERHRASGKVRGRCVCVCSPCIDLHKEKKKAFSFGSKAGQNILAGPGPGRLKFEAGAPS